MSGNNFIFFFLIFTVYLETEPSTVKENRPLPEKWNLYSFIVNYAES